MTETPRRVVAILGGGVTGAAVAFHLARALPPGRAAVVVIEPRARLGHGLAYDTDNPVHRINVPAARMTLVTDEPGHFDAWLDGPGAPGLDAGALRPNGDRFPRRSVFGRYIAAHLAPLLADGHVTHIRDRVTAARPGASGRGWHLELEGGGRLDADLLVLAATHPRPSLPGPLAAVAGEPGLVADTGAPGALDRIGPQASVLVVGSGLTAADVVATLDHRGHLGRIVMLSRHGYRSRGHAPRPQETDADFTLDPATTASGLLARVRAAVAADAARGLTWHAALDRVRAQGPAIWAALDPEARLRVVRHMRALWDVHRFRVAPQVEAVLDRLEGEGRIRLLAARLTGSAATGGRLWVCWRPRGTANEAREDFDAIVVTTGPAHAAAIAANPALASLAAAGRLAPDRLGLGLATDADGRALGADCTASPDLLVAGPLARGTVGELMGLPEVTAHAETTARRVLGWLAAKG